jgi:GntR family transcriptional repressor for pyruvate dehydrogenase complex
MNHRAHRLDPAPRQALSMEKAADRLRAIILAAADGAFLGSEDVLRSELGVARSTMRQVARILEREGLLHVRRGANGGYYARRPDIDVIERAASAYLKTESISLKDAITVATLLWPEVVRQAATSRDTAFESKLVTLETILANAQDNMTAANFLVLEREVTDEILALSGSKYIGLIFGINRMFLALVDGEDFRVTPDFVASWKQKLGFQLDAIRRRDEDMAVYAASTFRAFFQNWVETGMRPSDSPGIA